jgi:hypothetical protein
MFPNQIRFGKDIANAFLNPKIRSILAVAMTQSGKTGSMLSVIEHVKPEHVFLITGLSSVEWMDQTKSRFPEKYKDCIFHRNQLPTFVKRVKNLSNVLIIIDENQIAFKKDQTIHKCFVEAGIMNDLQLRNIRLVHFTATPSNTEDFVKHPFSQVVLMRPDSSYVSAFQLLKADRIKPYQDLCGIDKARADIKERLRKHTELVKQHDDQVKSNKSLKRNTDIILKRQLMIQKKTHKDIDKIQKNIDKTQDFLKKSEFMLEKLVKEQDLEQVNLLIRQNQNSLQQLEVSLQESEKIRSDSKLKQEKAKKALADSDRILKKLEEDKTLSEDDQLQLVGGPNAAVFENIRAIQPEMGPTPKYHIIRTSHSFYHTLTVLHFKRVFKNADFLSDVDMDELLAKAPKRHTFLFIKEKLRCAKTLIKDHLGVLYERITDKPQMDTILQGLVGRLTGYHKNTNSVVFSNPELVQEYKKHWDEQFKHHKTVIPRIMLGTAI